MAKHSKKMTANQLDSKNKKSFSMLPLSNSFDEGYVIASELDYIGISYSDQNRCYEPPVNRWALAKLPLQNAQHCGILNSRANMIANGYESGALSKMSMRALALNLIQFGDVGLLKVRNAFGQVLRLEPLSSLYLRKMKTGGYRYLVRRGLYDNVLEDVYEYDENDIIFIRLYDPMQQMYGLPDYVGGIQAALLNADATRFRRRYFANGSHLGFILYSTDPDMDDDMEEEIKQSIANSKGVGNFKSMFVNIAGGHPDGLKVIPIGDTGKKDEFGTIKDVSAQDILTAHRYPAGLAGVIPAAGSFGDIEKIRNTYRLDEVLPMQAMISEAINSDPDINAGLMVRFKSDE